MPSALFLGSSLSLDWVLHNTLIEGEFQHSRLTSTANSLPVVNVLPGMTYEYKRYTEETVRIQKTEAVVVGTVRIQQ